MKITEFGGLPPDWKDPGFKCPSCKGDLTTDSTEEYVRRFCENKECREPFYIFDILKTIKLD